MNNKYVSMTDRLISGAVSYDEGWYDSSDKPVSLNELQDLEGVVPGEEFSIYNVLPDDINDNISLFFRANDIYYSIYIDGEHVYTPDVQESIFYTKSLGTRYECISISPDDGGKEIEIRFSTVYSGSRACVDTIYLANSGGIVLDIVRNKLVAFVTCILIFFAGILLIIADIPANMRVQKNHELLYLGLFAITVSIWFLSETNLCQLYYNDSRTIQVLSCTSLMLIPIPIMLYLNSVFEFRIKYTVPLIFAVSIANIVISWTLHFLHIKDIHEMLRFSHVALIMGAISLIYSSFSNKVKDQKNNSRKVYYILRILGLCSLATTAVIDISRYYVGKTTDFAMFTRMGMLIFIICYGSSSLEKLINAVKMGVRSELISQLAYIDGLTGIGNRTAFEEKLAELEKTKNEVNGIGIAMFDLNNLKHINDNLGHHYGDKVIEKSAGIINDAFEPENGKCFRIGGDEFVVLLSGDNVQTRYEKGIQNFLSAQSAENSRDDSSLQISIAYGFCMYKKNSGYQTLNDVFQQADIKMYENKKKIKTKPQ
ncbi:MAG: GGDEF domain-containing protein [Lachnospiraceae bacterium]